jgi:hypothetical protein
VKTYRAFKAQMKREIAAEGLTPIRAVFDAAGNCTVCGDSGRCPGWHAQDPDNPSKWWVRVADGDWRWSDTSYQQQQAVERQKEKGAA